MASRLLKNHWTAIREDSRVYWGKLTEEDLDGINGQVAAFIAALRRRYGFSQVKAEDELERFLFGYEDVPAAGAVGVAKAPA